jgi:hypothetical protein
VSSKQRIRNRPFALQQSATEDYHRTDFLKGVTAMNAFAATAVYPCRCGAETHAFMECDGKPNGTGLLCVFCWRCGDEIAIVTAKRIWSASTAQAARRHRLMGLNDPIWQIPNNPADLRNTQTAVWDVL